MPLELDLTATDPMQRLVRRVAQLEHRLRDVERNASLIPIDSIPPTGGQGASGSISAQRVSSTSGVLWVRMDTTWYHVTVTAP